MFDAAAGIRNISRMLKPEGVVFHYEGARARRASLSEVHARLVLRLLRSQRFRRLPRLILPPTLTFIVIDGLMHEWSAFTDAGQLTMPMLLGAEAMVVACRSEFAVCHSGSYAASEYLSVR